MACATNAVRETEISQQAYNFELTSTASPGMIVASYNTNMEGL
jgi:hypothetical protein